MAKLEKLSSYLIYSLGLFSILSYLLSLNIWLDMRIHSSLLVYISFLISLLLINWEKIYTFISILFFDVMFLLILFLGKFNRVSYELREAFRIPIEINLFKIIFLGVFLLANILVFYDKRKKGLA